MIADDLTQRALDELGVPGPITIPDDALQTLLDSYVAGQRTPLSDLAFEGNVIRRLKNLMATAAATPTATARPVMVIAGLPRTGSTLLHNLLAANPEFDGIVHWDVHHSWWRLTPEEPAAARAEVQGRLDLMDAIGPGIRDAHPMQADWPEECTCVLENSFASYQWPITYGVPAYHRWLLDADQTMHYDLFRNAITTLCPGNGPLVLKSPFHILHLEHLRRIFPGVRVIQTVRRSEEVVSSWLRFVATTHNAIFEGAPPAGCEPLWVETLDRMATAAAADANNEMVVRYDQLTEDPIATLGSLLDAFGLELSPRHEATANAWMASTEAQRRGKGPAPAFQSTTAMRVYDETFDL